jgi:hypothetical protein
LQFERAAIIYIYFMGTSKNLDCFGALRLAMTVIASEAKQSRTMYLF